MAVMRVQELRGRPVISARTGDRLGRVSEVLIDLAGPQVFGFRLRCGGLLDRRWRVAAMEDGCEVSAHGITVPDALALREDEPLPGRVSLGGPAVAVVGENGAGIGRLADAVLDPATGRLLGLLVVPRGGWRMGSRRAVCVPAGQVAGARADTLVVNNAAEGVADAAY